MESSIQLTDWARRLLGALEVVSRICMVVAGTMLTILIVIFGWLVFGRYVLNSTPTWVEQAALMLVVWITFLGSAVGVARNSHLSIDFIREAMAAPIRDALRIFTDFALLIFGGCMAWWGFELAAATSARMVPMLGIAEAWRAVPLGICGLLIVLFSGSALVIRLIGRRSET